MIVYPHPVPRFEPSEQESHQIPSPVDLKHLRLFSGVSRSEIEDLLQRHPLKHYGAGKLILSAGEGVRQLLLLCEGIVKTYVYSPRGQQQIIHVFYPGDAFGGLVFGPDQEPWAEAMIEVTLVSMGETELKELMQTFPDVCMNILDSMVDHHRSHVLRMQTLIHNKASHRLVLTLLHLCDLQGDRDKDAVVIKGGFTHQDIANMIGVVRSTVSELMGELRHLGIVCGDRREPCVIREAAERFLSGV